jgi:osmotically-inducible protein OsmY
MNARHAKIATSLVIAALMGPVPAYAADTKSTKENIKKCVGDSLITTKINAEYANDKEVSALRIKGDTDDRGVATLSGTAKN